MDKNRVIEFVLDRFLNQAEILGLQGLKFLDVEEDLYSLQVRSDQLSNAFMVDHINVVDGFIRGRNRLNFNGGRDASGSQN